MKFAIALRAKHENGRCAACTEGAASVAPSGDPLISWTFVSGEARFVSGEAEATKWRGNGASLRGGLPTGAGAHLAARRRCRPRRCRFSCFARSACRISTLAAHRRSDFHGRPQGIMLFAPRRRGRFPSLSLDFLKIKPPNNPWFDFFLSFRDNIANHFIKEGFIYDWTGKGAANLARTGGV